MRKILATTAALGLTLAMSSAAYAAPGRTIQDQCGTSFGQLVAAGKSSGSAAHANYAGGAKAFSNPAILAAHGCGG